MVTNTASPGASSEPASGGSLVANGATGRFTCSIVSGALPTLRNTAVAEVGSPTAVPGNVTTNGEASSFAPSTRPTPESPKSTVALVLVVAVSVPPIGPEPLGVKVIGTWTASPVARVAGSACDAVPIVNWDELEASVESVSGSVAVSVSVFSEESPTVVVGNEVADPARIGVTGEPNAITCPSRVPTYSRPPPTPGIANFAEVPIGALQRRTGFSSTGIGSYARSWAPSPVPLGAHTIHTSAEPGSVSLEVITGALEEKPNASAEVPCSESVGMSVPEIPYW